ncbi:MAG: DUF4112 domain-containing protein [Verrucomicrobium sp.]|nr:DUF4112 domain-containing protein [Verrucomicrobium sp.]
MPVTKRPIEVEVDVLPPDGKGRGPIGQDAENASEISRIIARIMDDFIRIPGTNFRIGLDPIIGLVPGVGDLLASSVGLVLITEGLRNGLPMSALIRMATNILLNDAIGTIPGIGDLFSAWFKSNKRNLKLLNRWKSGDRAAVKRSSNFFLVGFILVWITLLGFWIFLWYMVARALYHMAFPA